MTTLYLIPFFGAGAQFFNNQGAVLANGRLSTMVAGSVNTPLATYTDSTGGTPNGNPIILDSAGRLPAGTEMWCATALKIVLTDSVSNPIAIWDNVPGINNVGVPTQLEYFLSGLTPTYVSGTQITVPGNQIALFTANRRVRYTQGAGVFYGYVTSSSFDGVVTTTINITADATVISNTVYQIDYAFLNSVNPSIPQQYLPQASVFIFGGTAGGTANALALTPANPVSIYAAGLFFVFKAGASNNSGGTTCAVSGLAALAVQVNGQACTGNEIQAGLTYILAMDTPTTMQLSELVVAHGETAKTALVDADEMFTADSAASFLRKKITWANVKATLVAYLVPYLAALTTTWGVSTTGNAATSTVATTALMRSFLSGLTLSTAGGSTTMSIAAGQALDSTNAVMLVLAAFTKTTASWTLGTAGGGLDTGTTLGAASTWYHWYLIRRPDTGVVDVTFSLSASLPTLPTNYTQYRRIGSALTDGSKKWTKFFQDGDEFIWDVPTLDVNSSNPGIAAVTRTLNVPTGLIVYPIFTQTLVAANSTQVNGLITALAQTDTAPVGSFSDNRVILATSQECTVFMNSIPTNTSAQIRSRQDASAGVDSLYINTKGWIDTRGRSL